MPTFSIPSTPLAVGEQIFGPFTIPAGINGIELHFNPRLLPDSAGAVLSQMWFDISPDGIAPYVQWAGTGFWGDPTFVDGKTGSTTDAVSRFSPVPSPSHVKVRTDTVTAFTLTGASVVAI